MKTQTSGPVGACVARVAAGVTAIVLVTLAHAASVLPYDTTVPTILRITPTMPVVGGLVIIEGDHFTPPGSPIGPRTRVRPRVIVTFNQEQARVVSASDQLIRVIAPRHLLGSTSATQTQVTLTLTNTAGTTTQPMNFTVGPATHPPALTSISPKSGPAGPAYPIQVTLTGSGFSRDENVVSFGSIAIPQVPAAGNTLTFWIPKTVSTGGEVPPRVLPPGEYEVTVTTFTGTSDPLTFTLTENP